MDGLAVTCRTCGVRTSFEDAGTHVCRPQRPLQQPGNGYEQQRRPDDRPSRQRSPSQGRNQYPPPGQRQMYPEPPHPRDNLTLGPNFDLNSLRSPHSYDGGPYAMKGPQQPPQGPSPTSRGPPPPRQPMQPNYDIQNGSRSAPPRNGPQFDPPPRQQYQQRPPPRQQYVEDYDYGRRPGPPMRVNTAPEPQRYPPPKRDYADYDQPMKSPLFQRSNSDLRSYRDQGRSPERRPEPESDRQYPEQDQRFDKRYDDNDTYRGRNDDSYNNEYDSAPLQRAPSNQSRKDAPSPPNTGFRQDQDEQWSPPYRGGKKGSVSSSNSSESDSSRSSRSQDTAPSSSSSPSSSSPISPSKNLSHPEYSATSRSSPLKQTMNIRDHSRTPSDERPSTTTKVSMPVCRACDEPIRGRSLASQDGKLTGRYHKHCFVCATCQKPFETASFYVFQDRPYCKQHYHELNNSMCAECGEGVEGACLQLEDCTIRHPDCFTCHTCHVQLGEDYFEANGQSYCDRHARMLKKNVNTRMERRKTRLLMM